MADEYSHDDEPNDDLSVEDWQLAEIRAGIADLDAGREVSHEEVSRWLRSWGTEDELDAPE
jgi:predicted transcriptional regulator